MVWKSVAPAATWHFLLFCALMDQVSTNQWRVLPSVVDLKFLPELLHARRRNFKSKTTLVSYTC
jgi:hypothetical protein